MILNVDPFAENALCDIFSRMSALGKLFSANGSFYACIGRLSEIYFLIMS